MVRNKNGGSAPRLQLAISKAEREELSKHATLRSATIKSSLHGRNPDLVSRPTLHQFGGSDVAEGTLPGRPVQLFIYFF
jgi:hypothetical protein